MRLIGLAAAAVLAAGYPASGAAQTPPQRQVLGNWVQEQFLAVGRSCIADLPNNDRIVPADIRSWNLLSSRWTSTVEVYNADTLDSIFSTVKRRVNGQYTTELMYQLGATGARTSPILYQLTNNALRKHNCATMLAGNATTSLNIGLPALRAALTANASQTTSQTAYAYAGRMISPLAVALSLNPTTPDAPSPISPFRAFMAVWDWYRIAPSLVAAGDRNELEIYSQMDGVAFYRTTGLTQDLLLSGSANIAGSVPFLAGRVTGSAQGTSNIYGANSEYAVAQWGLPTPARLPRAAEAAGRAASYARFTPSLGSLTGIEGVGAFTYTFELADTPLAYCRPDYWTLVQPMPGATQTAGTAIPTSLQIDYRAASATAAARCEFAFTFSPPQTASTSVILSPSVKSTITIAPQTPATTPTTLDLVLTVPPVRLTDYRGSLSALATNSTTELLVQAVDGTTAAVRFGLSYDIGERNSRRASGVVTGSTRLVLKCGQDSERVLALPSGAVKFGRADTGASLTIDTTVPPGALPAPGTSLDCLIDGRSTLATEGTNPPVAVDLPTHRLRLSVVSPVIPSRPEGGEGVAPPP